MTAEATIDRRLAELTSAVLLMARAQGPRLTRAQVCERLGVHRARSAPFLGG